MWARQETAWHTGGMKSKRERRSAFFAGLIWREVVCNFGNGILPKSGGLPLALHLRSSLPSFKRVQWVAVLKLKRLILLYPNPLDLKPLHSLFSCILLPVGKGFGDWYQRDKISLSHICHNERIFFLLDFNMSSDHSLGTKTVLHLHLSLSRSSWSLYHWGDKSGLLSWTFCQPQW